MGTKNVDISLFFFSLYFISFTSVAFRFGSFSSKFSLCKHKFYFQAPVRERFGVDVTSLTYIPNGRIDKYLRNLNFFFIRESTSIRENGGISGFVHSFITEVRFFLIIFNSLCYFQIELKFYYLFLASRCCSSTHYCSWRQCNGFFLYV